MKKQTMIMGAFGFVLRHLTTRLAYALLVPLLLVVYVAGLFVLPTAEMRALIDKITG